MNELRGDIRSRERRRRVFTWFGRGYLAVVLAAGGLAVWDTFSGGHRAWVAITIWIAFVLSLMAQYVVRAIF